MRIFLSKRLAEGRSRGGLRTESLSHALGSRTLSFFSRTISLWRGGGSLSQRKNDRTVSRTLSLSDRFIIWCVRNPWLDLWIQSRIGEAALFDSLSSQIAPDAVEEQRRRHRRLKALGSHRLAWLGQINGRSQRDLSLNSWGFNRSFGGSFSIEAWVEGFLPLAGDQRSSAGGWGSLGKSVLSLCSSSPSLCSSGPDFFSLSSRSLNRMFLSLDPVSEALDQVFSDSFPEIWRSLAQSGSPSLSRSLYLALSLSLAFSLCFPIEVH